MLEDAPLATVSSGCFYARKAQHTFLTPLFLKEKKSWLPYSFWYIYFPFICIGVTWLCFKNLSWNKSSYALVES